MKKAIKSIKKGFTLVELIVVILIIAILAGVATGSYFIYIGVANQSADQQTVANYNTALTTVNTYLASGENTIEADGVTYIFDKDEHNKLDTPDDAYTAVVAAGYSMSNPKGYSGYFVYVPGTNVFVIADTAGKVKYSQGDNVEDFTPGQNSNYYFVTDSNGTQFGTTFSGTALISGTSASANGSSDSNGNGN